MNLFIFSSLPPLLLAAGLIFRSMQNKGKLVGGDISLPKSLWLAYAIICWFFLPFIFLIWPVDLGLKYAYGFHLVSFWTRGILELFMIYKWYNWSPLYGISHNIFHLLIFVFLLNQFWPLEVTRPTLMAILYTFSLIISLSFETLFAILFYKVRGKGKHKIYFADDKEEWRWANLLTVGAVIICYGLLCFNAFIIKELAL